MRNGFITKVEDRPQSIQFSNFFSTRIILSVRENIWSMALDDRICVVHTHRSSLQFYPSVMITHKCVSLLLPRIGVVVKIRSQMSLFLSLACLFMYAYFGDSFSANLLDMFFASSFLIFFIKYAAFTHCSQWRIGIIGY